MLELYAKNYGKNKVTKNEFMEWVVKEYIVEQMGRDVDWATVATSTSALQATCIELELIKHTLS
jgi:hypothetical protein